MARISVDPPRTLLYRACEWYSMRKYGAVLDPGKGVRSQQQGAVVVSALRAEGGEVEPAGPHAQAAGGDGVGGANRVRLVHGLRVLGGWEQGMPVAKIRLVPLWREHRDAFTDVEVAVMTYAEAMTDTPPSVSDDLTEPLLAHLGKATFVELTATVALAACP